MLKILFCLVGAFLFFVFGGIWIDLADSYLGFLGRVFVVGATAIVLLASVIIF